MPVLGSGPLAGGHAEPFLGEKVEGQEELVVVHRLVTDSGPAVVAPDDYSEGSGAAEEEGVLREVDAVRVVLEDFPVGFFEALERKGVTTDPR